MDQLLNALRFPSLSESIGQTSIWAATVLLLGLMFRTPLTAVIAASDGLEAELGPVKLRVKRSLVAVQKAASVRAGEGISRKLSDRELRESAEQATKTDTHRLAHRLVLWVDDHPSNNQLERSSFEALGVRFVSVLNTEDALRLLMTTGFDLIISDMGRDSEGPTAGLDLLQRVRQTHARLPVIFYTSLKGVQQATQSGATGATAHPDELYRIVLSVLLEN